MTTTRKPNIIEKDGVYYAWNGSMYVDISTGLTSSNVGVANTGVVAQEFGNSRQHVTVLTVAQTDAITLADNAAIADGSLLYTFPAGAIFIHAAHMDLAVTHDGAESAAGAGEFALGTTLSTGAYATIGASAATDENICGPLAGVDTADAAVSTVKVSNLILDDTATRKCYFNIADTWANVASTALDSDIAGTVILEWTFLS